MKNSRIHRNLIPAFNMSGWQSWVQREGISPDFSKEKRYNGTMLKIESAASKPFFGKWICNANGILDGETYDISVEYLPVQVKWESVNIHMVVTWLTPEDKPLARYYIDCCSECEDGWKRLKRCVEAPRGVVKALVELVFWGSEAGSVYWRTPGFFVTGSKEHRKVRIASTLQRPKFDLEKNLKAMLEAVDSAAVSKPDVILLTEGAYDRGVRLPLEERCEAVPGKITGLMGEKARQYNTYIIVNLNEVDGAYYYNTTVLIDRQGEVAGKYRKTHLPLSEKEMGYTPGDEYPVFDTDFGRIGILTCMDQWFQDASRILRLKGAELIFVPTMGYAPVQSLARAIDNGVYLVISGGDGDLPSRIIAPDGEILAGAKTEEESPAFAEIDLDKGYYMRWFSVGNAEAEPGRIHIKERRQDTYGELLKDGFVSR